MAHTGRKYGTAVMLGKGGKVLVDYRLVTVAACHGRLQVVRHDGHRHTAEEMQRILTRPDQVLLALRPRCLAVGVVAARQDGDKHLHTAYLTSLGIHDFQFVTGIVNVHLVAGVMLNVAYCPRGECVTLQVSAESRVPVAVRMAAAVLIIERFHGHALAFRAGCIL